MNASRPLFPMTPRLIKPIGLLLGCAVVAGCAGSPFKDAKIDPDSPVAADVARISRQPTRFPTFAAIPKPPADIRPLPRYGRDARAVLAAGEDLTNATAPGTWTLNGTDDFAEKARQDAGPQIEPPKPGEAEAFARALRERATPPPPR